MHVYCPLPPCRCRGLNLSLDKKFSNQFHYLDFSLCHIHYNNHKRQIKTSNQLVLKKCKPKINLNHKTDTFLWQTPFYIGRELNSERTGIAENNLGRNYGFLYYGHRTVVPKILIIMGLTKGCFKKKKQNYSGTWEIFWETQRNNLVKVSDVWYILGMPPKNSEQYCRFLGGDLFTPGSAQTVFVTAVILHGIGLPGLKNKHSSTLPVERQNLLGK